MHKPKSFILSLATLAGTIIGVGMFSLPYLASQLGFWIIVLYLFLLGAIAIFIHSIVSELALNTSDFKRLPGFAGFYLGRWGKTIAIFSSIFGLLGAILAYLIVGGEFLFNLASPIFGGNSLIYLIIYFLSGAILIYFGIKAIEKVELIGLILFFSTLIFIFIKGLPFFDIKNLFVAPGLNFKISNLFLPYGPVLFSLWGLTLIPEIEEQLGKNKNLLKKVVFLSILIAILIYLFFVIAILGISGNQTTESALAGLKNFLNNKVLAVGYLFGILTTFTSFISLGLTLKKVLNYDLKIPDKLAWFITCFIPLIFFLGGIKNFIKVISFVGGIMLSIDGILICLMYHRLQKTKKVKILTSMLALIFILAIIYEFKYLVI